MKKLKGPSQYERQWGDVNSGQYYGVPSVTLTQANEAVAHAREQAYDEGVKDARKQLRKYFKKLTKDQILTAVGTAWCMRMVHEVRRFERKGSR